VSFSFFLKKERKKHSVSGCASTTLLWYFFIHW
jgi:hypothetical protein